MRSLGRTAFFSLPIIGGLTLVSMALLPSSCQLVVNSDSKQCSSDADCANRGLPDTVCSPLHTCVRKEGYCEHNTECVARFDNAPAVCVQNVCQKLVNDDCPIVLGTADEYSSDDVVLVGLMQTIAGSPLASQGLGGVNAVKLAKSNWTTALHGLPAAKFGGPTRPMVFVGCNELPDPVRSAKHLVDDLKVQALIGPQSSTAAVTVVQQVTVPGGVFTLLPVASTYTLTQVDRKGLVYRLVAMDQYYVAAEAALLKTVEDDLRAKSIVTDSAPMKVAVLYRGDATGAPTLPLFSDQLTFNGQKASDQASAPQRFLAANYGDFVDPTATAQQQAAVIAAVESFQPHVVITFGLGETFTIVQNIEKGWTNSTYFPTYFMHPTTFSSPWGSFIQGNEALRRRILGVVNSAPGSIPGAVKAAYDSTYTVTDAGGGGIWGPSASGSFDSVYLFGFAAIANGDHPFTGPNLAASMKQIGPPGQQVDPTSTNNILTASTALAGGQKVDYSGAVGEVVFNDIGDNSQPTVLIWCVDSAPPNAAKGSGLVWSVADKQLKGAITCFNTPGDAGGGG